MYAQPDELDHIVPDVSFLLPKLETAIEMGDEALPEIVEKEDDSEIIESMGENIRGPTGFHSKR